MIDKNQIYLRDAGPIILGITKISFISSINFLINLTYNLPLIIILVLSNLIDLTYSRPSSTFLKVLTLYPNEFRPLK